MKGFALALLASFLGITLALDVNQLTEEIKPLIESLIQKNNLTYKEPCDFVAEKGKQKNERKLLDLMGSIRLDGSFDIEQFKNNLIQTITSIVSIPSAFCNGYQNLQCSSKGFCDCAAVDESYGFKMSFHRDGDACLIAPGSLCAPSELMEQTRKNNPFTANTPSQEYRCSGKANCVVKSTRATCSIEAMQAEFKRHVDAQKTPIANPVEFFLQKTKEGICVCKGSMSALASSLLVSVSALWLTAKYFIN